MPDVQILANASVRLLRGPEAAETLAVSLRTLRSLVQRGVLPAVRIGRSVRFDANDLRRLIDQQKGAAHAK
jgi:excisionase family DNA binding protein